MQNMRDSGDCTWNIERTSDSMVERSKSTAETASFSNTMTNVDLTSFVLEQTRNMMSWPKSALLCTTLAGPSHVPKLTSSSYVQ